MEKISFVLEEFPLLSFSDLEIDPYLRINAEKEFYKLVFELIFHAFYDEKL